MDPKKGVLLMAVLPPKPQGKAQGRSCKLAGSLWDEIDEVVEATGYSRNEMAEQFFQWALANNLARTREPPAERTDDTRWASITVPASLWARVAELEKELRRERHELVAWFFTWGLEQHREDTRTAGELAARAGAKGSGASAKRTPRK